MDTVGTMSSVPTSIIKTVNIWIQPFGCALSGIKCACVAHPKMGGAVLRDVIGRCHVCLC